MTADPADVTAPFGAGLDLMNLTPAQLNLFYAGYEAGLAAGHDDGYQAAETAMAHVWGVLAARVRNLANTPTRDELTAARTGTPYRPVPTPEQCLATWGSPP